MYTKSRICLIQKALKSLIDKKFLHKNSKYYQLSTDTLIAEKRKIQSILDRYIEAESYHIFQKKEASYFFETLSELDYFWNKVVEQPLVCCHALRRRAPHSPKHLSAVSRFPNL